MKIEEKTSCFYFQKIKSIDREIAVLVILRKNNPEKKDRLWIVGFLKFVGYDCSEIYELIKKYNKWDNYNEIITNRMIDFVFNLHGAKNGKTQTPRTNPVPTSMKADDLIDLFLKECKPFFPKRIAQIRDMAIWYYSNGFHVIPSAKNSKKPYPGILWGQYQNIQPGFDLIQRWDWSNGIIIVGTDRHCFLDIDMKSVTHPDGLNYFDENRLKGFCWERTKSGGYHVFGLGNFGYMKVEPVSIRGKGAYIVTSPTSGYRIV